MIFSRHRHLHGPGRRIAKIGRLSSLAPLAVVPLHPVQAQEREDTVRISLAYTGGSLGALGVLRAQETPLPTFILSRLGG